MPRLTVADADLNLAVTDDDHDTLQSQLGDLADSDLQATHDHLHATAAAGKLLPKFSKDDMERLHGAVESEQAQRAQATGQAAPAPSPLKWPTGGALQTNLPDAAAARLPGHLSAIRDRKATSLKNVDKNVGGGVDRDQLPTSDFVFPEDAPDGGFPIVKAGDVSDAVSSWGRYKGPHSFADFKKNLTAIAKRKGFTASLPESWTQLSVVYRTDKLGDGSLVLSSFYRIDEIDLSTTATGTRQSWMQVARTGEFVSSRYGEFSITTADLSRMLSNFKTKIPLAPTRIPVDYDHLSMDPQRPGDGKAAGWFNDLELRDNGETLWGLVEWTPDAADAIDKKEYQYVSPSFARNYTDKQGDKIGPTLLAAAITNHPFLEGMAPLTLSSQGDLAIHLMSPSARTVHTDTTLGQENHMSASKDKTFKMKDSDGKDVEIPMSEMENCSYVKSLKDKMPKDDEKVVKANEIVSGEEVVSLRKKATEQAEELTQLRADRITDRRERQIEKAQARFDTMVAKGFATAAEKDRAIKLAKRDVDTWNGRDAFTFDLFEDWCADHKIKVLSLNTVRGHGEDDTQLQDDPVEGLLSLVADKQKADTKLSYTDAWSAVCREHPEAYENYRKATAQRV